MPKLPDKKYDKTKLTILRGNIRRAKNRPKAWPLKVDEFEVYEIGEQQDWLCAITKVPLEFIRGREYWQNKWCNPRICSMDRIDPTLGYITGNIQLLTHYANVWKSNFTNQELKELSESFLRFSE